jgi:hypothetical protein
MCPTESEPIFQRNISPSSSRLKRRHVPPERLLTSNGLNGVKLQNTGTSYKIRRDICHMFPTHSPPTLEMTSLLNFMKINLKLNSLLTADSYIAL